jgi:DNA polymerase III delta subunit
MIETLLGEDDYTKWKYVKSLAAQKKAEVEVVDVLSGQQVDLNQFVEQTLFGIPKIFVVVGGAEKFGWAKKWDAIESSVNMIFILQNKIDQRTQSGKFLSTNSKAKFFSLPHGAEFDGWLKQQFENLNVKISKTALEELAKKMGRDNFEVIRVAGKIIGYTEMFDLWQVSNEVEKIAAFAGGREVALEDIGMIVNSRGQVETLQIADAIAEKNFPLAYSLIDNLFLESAADPKSTILQTIALLSEQFRGLILIKESQERGMSDNQLIENTGWRNGRVYILKKIAGRFEKQKLVDFINKLESLDEEVKTSSLPARVVLEMLISQLR